MRGNNISFTSVLRNKSRIRPKPFEQTQLRSLSDYVYNFKLHPSKQYVIHCSFQKEKNSMSKFLNEKSRSEVRFENWIDKQKNKENINQQHQHMIENQTNKLKLKINDPNKNIIQNDKKIFSLEANNNVKKQKKSLEKSQKESVHSQLIIKPKQLEPQQKQRKKECQSTKQIEQVVQHLTEQSIRDIEQMAEQIIKKQQQSEKLKKQDQNEPCLLDSSCKKLSELQQNHSIRMQKARTVIDQCMKIINEKKENNSSENGKSLAQSLNEGMQENGSINLINLASLQKVQSQLINIQHLNDVNKGKLTGKVCMMNKFPKRHDQIEINESKEQIGIAHQINKNEDKIKFKEQNYNKDSDTIQTQQNINVESLKNMIEEIDFQTIEKSQKNLRNLQKKNCKEVLSNKNLNFIEENQKVRNATLQIEQQTNLQIKKNPLKSRQNNSKTNLINKSGFNFQFDF